MFKHKAFSSVELPEIAFIWSDYKLIRSHLISVVFKKLPLNVIKLLGRKMET